LLPGTSAASTFAGSKDQSLEASAKLPDPQVLAEEIADDLRSASEQIESVLGELQQRATM
jgi:hypothetical protein